MSDELHQPPSSSSYPSSPPPTHYGSSSSLNTTNLHHLIVSGASEGAALKNNLVGDAKNSISQSSLALHLLKRELLRIQTHIDKIQTSSSSSTASTPYNDIKSLESYLFSLGNQSNVNNNNNNKRQANGEESLIISELLILLWKKFDQLQTLRGIPSKKKWIAPLPSSTSSPLSSNSNNNNNKNTTNISGLAAMMAPETNLRGPFESLLFEEKEFLESNKKRSRSSNNKKNSKFNSNNNADGEMNDDDEDFEQDENAAANSNNSNKNKNAALSAGSGDGFFVDRVSNEEEIERISRLLQGRCLIRSSSNLRPETIRAIVNCCRLDTDAETLLRQASGALQRQKLQEQFSSAPIITTTTTTSTTQRNYSQQKQGNISAAPSASAILENVAVEMDLDGLLRRVCSMVETFANELAVERRKVVTTTAANSATSPQQHQQQQLRYTSSTPPPSMSSPSAQKNRATPLHKFQQPSTPLHRMLQLPPMTATMNNTTNPNSPMALDSQNNEGLLSPTSTATLMHNTEALSPNSRRTNDILERERRQHAVETTHMESQLDILSRKIDQLEQELEKTHEHYKQKQKDQEAEQEKRRPTQQNELVTAKAQLTELNDACSGLQKTRKEETKRSLQIIADLEKQVAKQQEALAVRELEVDRLEGAISSFVELHLTVTQRSTFELESRAEFAQKCLLLREKSYPHALVVENHQLREKLFEAQCQSDEREKSLALTQQKLRDAKEQLQISDAEASGFITKLKTSPEWRALTLAAGDETSAAVKVVGALFDQRKSALKQQEDAQATRFRMLELRLGEEVVARRQKNVQNVAASDEADKMLGSYQEQIRGMEDVVMRKQLQKKLDAFYHIAPANALDASAKASVVTKMKDDITGKVISRALEKGKNIPLKDLKLILEIEH